MLPIHIALNVKKQILYYLQSTFSFRDKKTDDAFQRFIEDSEAGLFKGPWIQLKRPFTPAPSEVKLPFDIHVPFHPFLHQYKAWLRLSSKKTQHPQNTIITTGTGSGKTECFLFPVLDHCLRMKNQGQKGVKAIVLYPMNALAADQEKRFAKTIWENPDLKRADIRVGNYTGRYDPADPGRGRDSGTRIMGKDHGITHQQTQLDTPPDILLTNYRMLDFLLMRPRDANLWRFNEPGVLAYLVLDELHTYDGAQGADVACLIRRLKERLVAADGQICVVGTSATLDDRDRLRELKTDGTADMAELNKDRLANFAETLFGEKFPMGSVIDEDRLSVEQIISSQLSHVAVPDPKEFSPDDDESALAYVIRQSVVWGGPAYLPSAEDNPEEKNAAVKAWELELGKWIRGLYLFKYLLDIFDNAEKLHQDPLRWDDLKERLCLQDLGLRQLANPEDREMAVASFCSLASRARELRGQTAIIMAPTQVQLWIRELRRLGRVVQKEPAFSWLDEPAKTRKSLPVFHCSECGESGWVAAHLPDEDSQIYAQGVSGWAMDDNPARIYREWFGRDGNQRGPSHRGQYIFIISPETDPGAEEENRLPEQLPLMEMDSEACYFCPESLVIRRGDGPCPLTGDGQRFRVKIDRQTRKTDKQGVVGDQKCPRCGSREGLFLVGAQAATLASVAIDEMFGSVLNQDPKLLAFTDSVQDASHRAGYFSARTYHFTFRTALQHLVNDAGAAGLPMHRAGRMLLEYWSQIRPGGPGSLKEAMTLLMPPDLQEYPPFVEYRNHGGNANPPGKLLDDIQTRLFWQAVSEFSLMQTHGRSMELNGAACLQWDEDMVAETIRRLKDRSPKVSTELEKIPDELWRVWIYGILHRYRERGALDHPYLYAFAKDNFWGKYPFGKTVAGRETHPPAIRYKPRLLVTQYKRGHEHVLAPTKGKQPPWHLVWSRRALKGVALRQADLIDLIRLMLTCAGDAGLLKRLYKDGERTFYAISSRAARLIPHGIYLVCSDTHRGMVRPRDEADYWENAPSMEYYAQTGRYRVQPFTPRQRYYQDRYKKGALRRVVAEEHTGLLATEEREDIEKRFKGAVHKDDPNVLACTSTLEMGIDIGDLSSTMLCSIPPDTAGYLQRIGRAGRATGSALILSIVNQRPHDLFFYARPVEMLKGKVDPPGCWLDASAVLVRQYLGFCFDSAVRKKILEEIPHTGGQLVKDLNKTDGYIPSLMAWVAQNEPQLQNSFLRHFAYWVQSDTRERFLVETESSLLLSKMHSAVEEFDRTQKDLDKTHDRLIRRLNALDAEEQQARLDISRELRIINGRIEGLKQVKALELLTDNGLLPNYAFPEKGVRFYGAVYNRYGQQVRDLLSIELFRNARAALRELAPRNTFYTHRRQFEIQQIVMGDPEQPLTETWAICGVCGHMRKKEELDKPDAGSACPQCGHSGDSRSQNDVGQHRPFVEFARSQALSYMEHYESLSGDKDEERQRGFYSMIPSFDMTREKSSSAVGDDELPFGIEYRSSMILREVNTGYGASDDRHVPFGPDVSASESGFTVCQECGVVIPPEYVDEDKIAGCHRRSCKGRRRYEKLRQESKNGQPFKYTQVYLYRQLKSEAIRLLLPLTDDEDIQTLVACIYLGLRLQFEGNPAHLMVQPQIIPQSNSELKKHYLVIMDAVPGGTGFLKTLYQEKDGQNREGEGIMKVIRLAKNALETCRCRSLVRREDLDDTDGCYRCIRTYHLQYRSDQISRERGISLLNRLIASGENRTAKSELDEIKNDSLYGSVLEKKFADCLKDYVTSNMGKWEETIIAGRRGFRFSIRDSRRIWELELQPSLGPAQGVMAPCQPDFMLHCDDDSILPIAIFTDGFEFHCFPNNRLADDFTKRRAILESRNYRVWSITWEDLNPEQKNHVMVCHPGFADLLSRYRNGLSQNTAGMPDPIRPVRNGMEQLLAFIAAPSEDNWRKMADFTVFCPLSMVRDQKKIHDTQLEKTLNRWRTGGGITSLSLDESGKWVYNERASLTSDFVAYALQTDVAVNAMGRAIIVGRLGDGEEEVTGSDFKERWRRFLACANLFQFREHFSFWTTSQAAGGNAPEISMTPAMELGETWQSVVDEVIPSLVPVARALAKAGLPPPVVEYVNDGIDDDAFAEMAWKQGKVAVLAGDQADFAQFWQNQGWKVILPPDMDENGVEWVIHEIKANVMGES